LDTLDNPKIRRIEHNTMWVSKCIQIYLYTPNQPFNLWWYFNTIGQSKKKKTIKYNTIQVSRCIIIHCIKNWKSHNSHFITFSLQLYTYEYNLLIFPPVFVVQLNLNLFFLPFLLYYFFSLLSKSTKEVHPTIHQINVYRSTDFRHYNEKYLQSKLYENRWNI